MDLLSLFACIVAAGLSLWIYWPIYIGIKTGKIPHTNSTLYFEFKSQPFRFVALAIFFLILGSIFLYYAILRGYDFWISIS